MDLSDIPTRELSAELGRRKQIEREEHEAAMKAAYLCPECGADPVKIEQDAVQEHRMAPHEFCADGLYLPYESELGMTIGMDYETTVTCENGHVTTKRDTRWLEKPRKGPPMLSR